MLIQFPKFVFNYQKCSLNSFIERFQINQAILIYKLLSYKRLNHLSREDNFKCYNFSINFSHDKIKLLFSESSHYVYQFTFITAIQKQQQQKF